MENKLENDSFGIVLGNRIFFDEIPGLEVPIKEHDIQPVNRRTAKDEIYLIAHMVIPVVFDLIPKIGPFIQLFIQMEVMVADAEIIRGPYLESKIQLIIHHVTPRHQVHDPVKPTVRGAKRPGKGIGLVIARIRITAGIYSGQHEIGRQKKIFKEPAEFYCIAQGFDMGITSLFNNELTDFPGQGYVIGKPLFIFPEQPRTEIISVFFLAVIEIVRFFQEKNGSRVSRSPAGQ